MSLKTWKRKYYPTTASTAARRGTLASVRHSLKKWSGLSKEILEEHDLRKVGYTIIDNSGDSELRIADTSCALCIRYIDRSVKDACHACPLAIVRGGVPCDEKLPSEEISPYHIWTWYCDPQPMIDWLKQTEVYVKKEESQTV